MSRYLQRYLHEWLFWLPPESGLCTHAWCPEFHIRDISSQSKEEI